MTNRTSSLLMELAAQIKWFAADVDGVLTDGGMYQTDGGEHLKKFNVRDGLAVSLLRSCGIDVAIITNDNSEVVRKRAERLTIRSVFTSVEDKVAIANQLCEREGIRLENLAYIGDDLPDMDLLGSAGLAFVVADAHPMLFKVADYVCQRKGGQGAFREAAEWLIEARGLDLSEIWGSMQTKESYEEGS